MQIRKIHLERFGIFNGRELSGLKPGLNLLFGPNESGKTTVLQFVRWMLFGEQTKIEREDYTPQDGGEPFGHLELEHAEGETLTVNRSFRTKTMTQVEVHTARGTEGEGFLDLALGHATGPLYQNIFAVTLDELQTVDALVGPEVQDILSGAGMGLGSLSLGQFKSRLEQSRSDLFKPSGKKPRMNLLLSDIRRLEKEIRELQKDLPRYEQLNKSRIDLQEKSHALEETIGNLDIQKRRYEAQRDLYEHFEELERLETDLGQMADPVEIGESTLERFHELRAELKTLSNQVKEEGKELAALEGQSRLMEVDDVMRALEPEILPIRNKKDQIRSIMEDLIRIREERRKLDADIREHIRRVDPNWDEARIQELMFGEGERGSIRSHRERLDEAQERVAHLHALLEEHERERASASARGKLPSGFNWFVGLLVLIGLAGLGLGVFLAEASVAAMGGVITVLALGFYFFSLSSASRTGSNDPKGVLLKHQLKEARHEQAKRTQYWQEWLVGKRLDHNFSPDTVLDLISTLKEIQLKFQARDGVENRIRSMQETYAEVEARVEGLFQKLKLTPPSNDLAAAMEHLLNVFDDNHRKWSRKKDKSIQIQEKIDGQQRLAKLILKNQEELKTLIEKSGGISEDDFLEKIQLAKSFKDIETQIGQKKKIIRSRVGVDEMDKFLKSLRSTTPDEIKHYLEEVDAQLKSFRDDKKKVEQEFGQARGEIEHLASEDRHAAVRLEVESKKAELKLCFEQWAVNTVALEILKRTVRQYEETRQPAVIQAASTLFSRITDGRYSRIIRSPDRDILEIEEGAGRRKTPDQLSRGTREQLYLAIRLGLIQEYETQSEPLPVLMDDVWVNFDDARRERFVEELAGFAESRQVLVMSCHEASRELCVRHGAHVIPF